MEILGILLGVAILIFLAYKGLSIYYLAPLAALVVAVLNKMSLLEALTHFYMDGVVHFVMAMFIIVLLGSILGALYGESGATVSVAHGLKNGLTKEVKNEDLQQLISIFIIAGSCALLAYGGIDALAMIFAVFPLIVSIMKENNIPRRFLPALLLAGGATGIVALPGAPQLPNLIPAQVLGSDPRGALIPGIIGWMIAFFGSIVFLHFVIKKAKANGESFDYGEAEYMLANKHGESKDKKPHFIIALIPIAAIFALFNIFRVHIILALFAGVVLSIILFWKYLGDGSLKSVISVINGGAHNAPNATFSVASIAGFGSVVAASAGFKVILAWVTSIKGPGLLIAAISTAVMTGVAGSAPGGLSVSMPVLGPIFVEQMGINADAFHRVAVFAACTIDTLPINGGIILLLGMTGLTHKQSYPAIAACTVLFTTLATLTVLVLLTLFPGLA